MNPGFYVDKLVTELCNTFAILFSDIKSPIMLI